MKRAILIYVFMAFTTWGCPAWVMVGGPYSSNEDSFAVDLPNGWRKFSLGSDGLRITRDGLSLQEIRIARVEIAKELPHTKKKLSKNMLPQEVAELIVDDFKANANIGNHQIDENVPSRIGGRPGFKIMYTYKTNNGLRMKATYYGVMLGESYYYLLYQATDRHYFAKDYTTFERVKETFRFLPPDKP